MVSDLTSLRLALAVASTIVYVAVGVVVGRRQVSRESLVANRAFQSWWYGLAVITLFNPIMLVLDGLEAQTGKSYFGVRLLLFQFVLIGIVLAIGALVYYLLYVWSGKTSVFWPVAGYHLLVLAWLMYIVAEGHPTSYGPNCPSAGWCYEKDFSGTKASLYLSLSIILPILLSAFAYFALFFRVEGAAQRYRIAMVSGALIVWFGSSLASSLVPGTFETASGEVQQTTLNQWVYWSQVVSHVISLVASLVIFLAYRPPAFIRRSLGDATGG